MKVTEVSIVLVVATFCASFQSSHLFDNRSRFRIANIFCSFHAFWTRTPSFNWPINASRGWSLESAPCHSSNRLFSSTKFFVFRHRSHQVPISKIHPVFEWKEIIYPATVINSFYLSRSMKPLSRPWVSCQFLTVSAPVREGFPCALYW
jgi:hypothetical protein